MVGSFHFTNQSLRFSDVSHTFAYDFIAISIRNLRRLLRAKKLRALPAEEAVVAALAVAVLVLPAAVAVAVAAAAAVAVAVEEVEEEEEVAVVEALPSTSSPRRTVIRCNSNSPT